MKTINEVAHEVINGYWGNGDERRRRLEAAGYNYYSVQSEVNRILGVNKPAYDVNTIAMQVLDGKWGNGEERKRRLQAAGYDYWTIQAEVNRLVSLGVRS